MKKLLPILISLLVLLTGCTDEQAMPKKEFTNPYASRQILILSKAGPYQVASIERIVRRINKTYNITVDDLSTAYGYNFSAYERVVYYETLQGNQPTNLNQYLQGFTGVNNILLIGLGDSISPTPPVQVLVYKPISENIVENTETIISIIRGGN
jgi:hypothetical protein